MSRRSLIVGAVALILSGCAAQSSSVLADPSATPFPVASVTPVGPTASPRTGGSPAAAPSVMPDAVGALAETDDHIYPGTYTPLFQPPLTFTVAHEVDLSCAPGFRCRGDIEVNQPGWLGLGFGNAPSFEVTINRLDKVIDPNRKGAMVDPPKELPDWIAKLPGITLVAPPKHIEIGGLDAVQLDIRTSDKGVTFGPIPPPGAPFDFGFGPHDSHRIIAVNVARHAVLIVIGVVRDSPGTVVTPAQLQPAIDALQPLVDSIVWQ